jgi:hypothetical protein
MWARSKLQVLAVLALLLSFNATVAAQDDDNGKKKVPDGVPVLWREPADISTRDLRHGAGGAASRPNLSNVTFIKEEKGGFSTKYRVKDGAGREWVVKIGKEAQSETAATRLLWAAGYPTEIVHLMPRVNIRGKGTFRNVRFEARPKSIDRAGEWKWGENPFVGTREFQGLKVMMVLLNNWDIKDSNNVILHVPRGGRDELHYAISDLGATLGKTGRWPVVWRFTRSRNDPEGFTGDRFIDEIKSDGRVDFHFSGKKRGIFNDITVDDARWIGSWLARLSDRQLADAFRAANYTPSEVRMYARAIRWRINQLANLGRGRTTQRARRN